MQYAKFHMLQIYYDFMDKYIERNDFEFCEIDIDYPYMTTMARNGTTRPV